MEAKQSSDEGEYETIENFDALEKGDTVRVTYNSAYGGRVTKEGEVTYLSDHAASVDTLEETDNGEPIIFEVNRSGYVQSLTGDSYRRLTARVGGRKDTVIEVEQTPAVRTDGGENNLHRSKVAETPDDDPRETDDGDGAIPRGKVEALVNDFERWADEGYTVEYGDVARTTRERLLEE